MQQTFLTRMNYKLRKRRLVFRRGDVDQLTAPRYSRRKGALFSAAMCGQLKHVPYCRLLINKCKLSAFENAHAIIRLFNKYSNRMKCHPSPLPPLLPPSTLAYKKYARQAVEFNLAALSAQSQLKPFHFNFHHSSFFPFTPVRRSRDAR